MEKSEILKLLDAMLFSSHFAEPATLLARAVQESVGSISVSNRFVPAVELQEIYANRLDWMNQINVRTVGLAEAVELLRRNSTSSFRVVGLRYPEAGGAMFLSEHASEHGCFVIAAANPMVE